MLAALGEGETNRVTLQAEHFLSSHALVAFEGDPPVGCLRFVVQRIGEDEQRPRVTFNGKALEEAKVIPFNDSVYREQDLLCVR